MGRRHSIAARKASGDAAKSRIYAKIGRIIQMAAKKGADPSMNPSLELALQKARYHGLPRDVIDKAIAKGSGQLGSDNLEEVLFEGYGPGGTAIMIRTLTENTNRTSMTVKTILSKNGGSLGKPGSVARQFTEYAIFTIDGKSEFITEKGKQVEKIHPLNIEDAELELMDLEIENIESENNTITVYASKSNFTTTQDFLREHNYHIVEGELHFIPNDYVNIDDESKAQLQTILEQLEEDDDVSNVYHNANLD